MRCSPLKKGVGAIAQKAQLPIVPIGIRKNDDGLFIISIGKLISNVSDAEVTHEKICAALADLTASGTQGKPTVLPTKESALTNVSGVFTQDNQPVSDRSIRARYDAGAG